MISASWKNLLQFSFAMIYLNSDLFSEQYIPSGCHMENFCKTFQNIFEAISLFSLLRAELSTKDIYKRLMKRNQPGDTDITAITLVQLIFVI